MQWLLKYFCEIKPDKAILWCYFIWYLVAVYFYFDPTPKIWINSLGISAVIGTALMLSVSSSRNDETDHWQTVRLYLMPFCVSSFSALIKDRGFVVVVSPDLKETLISALGCLLFVAAIWIIKTAKDKMAW